jgi:hypothetical protein
MDTYEMVAEKIGKVAPSASDNTCITKLPTHEAVFEATGAEERHRWVTQQFYDELCRQLQHA